MKTPIKRIIIIIVVIIGVYLMIRFVFALYGLIHLCDPTYTSLYDDGRINVTRVGGGATSTDAIWIKVDEKLEYAEEIIGGLDILEVSDQDSLIMVTYRIYWYANDTTITVRLSPHDTK